MLKARGTKSGKLLEPSVDQRVLGPELLALISDAYSSRMAGFTGSVESPGQVSLLLMCWPASALGAMTASASPQSDHWGVALTG